MSDSTPKGLKFGDIVRRQQTEGTSRYWHEARTILTNTKYNRQVKRQGDFWVTPSIENSGITFALARMATTEQPFLIINSDFDNPVEITRNGEAALVMLSSREPIDEDIESILHQIDAVLAERADYRKRQAEELAKKAKMVIGLRWHKFVRWFRINKNDILGFTAVIGGPLIVIALIIIGVSSCDMGDIGAETKAFDAAHPNMVIAGQRVNLNEKVTLGTIGIDFDKNVPLQPGREVDEFPRAYKVYTDTCPEDSKADIPNGNYTNFGRLDGDEYLLVETNAPAGIIHTQISPIGDVLVCATDPTNVGFNNGPSYKVLMQTREVK